jgi:peptide/nickel transport system permease protein
LDRLTLIEYLAVRLHVLPVAGYGSPDATALEHLTYLIMPAIALGIPNSALIIRFTRTSMLDVLQEDYVRTARAKGLATATVIFKHAFRNARTSVVSGMLRRDYPVIQGALLVISGVYVLINFGIDILYAALDPRVCY